MEDFDLAVVIPVFNEEKTVLKVINNVSAALSNVRHSITVVDDGSNDGTEKLLRDQATLNWASESAIRVIRNPENQGKGAAVLTGIKAVKGTHLLIFDSDLEYNPKDISLLLEPIFSERARIVFGVRLRGQGTLMPSYLYYFGNQFLTLLVNLIYGSAISDMHTCLKLVPLDEIRKWKLTRKGFGLDTEIVCEMLKNGNRPYEVPISYVGRTASEGKKITWRHAIESIFVMVVVRTRGRRA